jgi:acyl-CoA synthetase (AMP-forming)/AMP-acid ligase II
VIDEITIQDSWRMFRIMAEFVEGFEMLGRVGPAVSIFGSSRVQPGELVYEQTVALARGLAEAGYAVISGGGPGVMEAAVIGIPDPKRGESPMAFIIPRPGKKVTEEELIQFCKDNLANYKVIKAVKFVKEFPRNPNRKVLKRELREMLKK